MSNGRGKSTNMLTPDDVQKVRAIDAMKVSDANRASGDRSTGPTVKNVNKVGHGDIATKIAREAEKCADAIEAVMTPEELAAQDRVQRLDMLCDCVRALREKLL